MKLDDCFDPRIIIPNSYAVVHIGIYMSFLYGFYLLFITSRPVQRITRLSIYFGIFFIFVNLVELLKVKLGDYNCNTVPNSVSGFSFVCVYNFMLWMFDYLRSGKYKTLIHKLLFSSVELLCMFNITATFIGGYHSPRQMIYGAMCSLAALVLVLVLFRLMEHRASVMAVSCGIALTMIASRDTADNPHAMLFFGVLLILMNFYTLFRIKKESYYFK